MQITKSSRLFLERAGLKDTHRRPLARSNPGGLAIQQLTLPRGLPLPDLLFQGDPPPDRPETTEPWPHGLPDV